ncbi:MAG: DUF4389 domain-containing protein [Desulfobacterales bacterium]|jgi:hypothetical protein|nr:DUF4389 domain-containing protein [Desulfobacterales bacterium]MDZ7598884.1 DUF4389 domain-containing protein [Desulfobacterales bacterium]
MTDVKGFFLSRKDIAIRFLYTLLFMAILEIVKLLVQLTVLFQFVYVFFTMNQSQPAARFANRLAAYLYRIARYMSLNEQQRPFPFRDLPDPVEPPEGTPPF